MREKIFFFTKTPGYHTEEKFGLEAMDPTPKRNLIRERRIHPEEKSDQGAADPTLKRNRSKSPGSHPEGYLGWENRMEKKSEVDLDQKS